MAKSTCRVAEHMVHQWVRMQPSWETLHLYVDLCPLPLISFRFGSLLPLSEIPVRQGTGWRTGIIG